MKFFKTGKQHYHGKGGFQLAFYIERTFLTNRLSPTQTYVHMSHIAYMYEYTYENTCKHRHIVMLMKTYFKQQRVLMLLLLLLRIRCVNKLLWIRKYVNGLKHELTKYSHHVKYDHNSRGYYIFSNAKTIFKSHVLRYISNRFIMHSRTPTLVLQNRRQILILYTGRIYNF